MRTSKLVVSLVLVGCGWMPPDPSGSKTTSGSEVADGGDVIVTDAGVDSDGGVPDAGTDAGNPQATYTYPGCEDHGTRSCPRDEAFECALEAIRTKHASCSEHDDCALVQVQTCTIYGACLPVAIAAEAEAAYREELAVEIDRYCTDATCLEVASCKPVSNVTAECLDQVCVLVQ